MTKRKIAGCIVLCMILSTLVCGAYAADQEKINVNAATVKELAKVPGLNQALAEKIIELREENGEFIDLEELLDIEGIDNKLLRELKKHLYIEAVDDCNC